jgi:PAS domain S-box-containing protein
VTAHAVAFWSGLQLELAMALSESVELDAILRSFLSVLLHRLDGRLAAVYAAQPDGTQRLVHSIPRRAAVPERLGPGPKYEYTHTPHRFALPGYGTLVFDRAEPLDPIAIAALEPLAQRLGRTARAWSDQAALGAAQARFAALVAGMRDAVFEGEPTPEGGLRLQTVSDQALALLGRPPADLVADPHALEGAVHPEDRAALRADLRRAAAAGEPVERALRLADDPRRWIELRAAPPGPDRRPGAPWTGTARDITDRQRLADLEREAERRKIEALLGAVDDAIVVVDHASRILHWNRGAERLFGHAAAAALGQPLSLIIPERHQAAHTAGHARVVDTGEARILGKRVELPAQHADGHEIPVELVLSRAEDRGGLYFIGVLRDIRDRVRAAEQADRRAAEERELSAALLEIGRAVVEGQPDVDVFAVGRLAAALRGVQVTLWTPGDGGLAPRVSAGEAPGVHGTGALSPAALEVPLSRLEARAAQPRGLLRLTAAGPRPWTEAEQHAAAEVGALLSRAGERAERLALEARFEVILGAVSDGVVACGPDGRVTVVNPAAAALLGRSPEAARGLPFHEVVRLRSSPGGPIEAPPLDGAGAPPCCQARVIRAWLDGAGGESIPVQASFSAIHDRGRCADGADGADGAPGAIAGVVVTLRDARDELAARAALEQQNQHLRAIGEANPDLLFTVRRDGWLQSIQDTPSPDLMVPRDEIPAQSVQTLFAPALAAELLEAVGRAIDEGAVQTVVYELPLPHGPQTFEARFARMSAQEAAVIVRNMTEIRDRNRSLELERERLRAVLASTSAIIYSARLPDFGIEYVSESAEAVLGFSADEFSAPGFRDASIHPDDKARVHGGLGDLFERGALTHEYRHRHARGGYRWLRDEVRLVLDGQGAPVRAVGASFDITDRKIGERRLSALLEVQQIVSRLSSGFLATTPEGIDGLIMEALADLGRLCHAERAYVFMMDGPAVSNTHEWCAPGITPQQHELQDLPADQFAFILDPLRAGQPLHVPAVADLPPDAVAERESLEAQGIRAMLHVPVMRGGELQGLVGVDDPDFDPLEWTDFAGLMSLLADALAAGLQRVAQERALQALNQRLTQKTAQQRMMLEFSDALARASSRSAVLATARSWALRTPATRVWVTEVHEDGRARASLLVADAAVEASTPAGVAVAAEIWLPRSALEGSAAERAMERLSAVSTAEHGQADFPDWELGGMAPEHGQYVVVPLLRGRGQASGAFSVGFNRRAAPTAEEIELIAQFGGVLGAHLAIQSAREAVERLNQELEARVEQRTLELRASDERFQHLFAQAPQAMLILDPAGRVVQSNQNGQRLFGLDDAGLRGRSWVELVPGVRASPDSAPGADRAVEARKGDGQTFFAEVGFVPIDLAGGRHLIAGVEDVTERRAAEAAVKRSLHEKETLLKEIHHRVKNNLQVISSLLRLQARRMPPGEPQKMLEESVLRISSMALIHQQLYGVESLARVELGRYASSLGEALRRVLAPSRRLRIEAVSSEVTVEIAVPMGLILNELLTNAFKYGLPDGDDGPSRTGEADVVVELRVADGWLVAAVSDRGRGLPPGFDLEGSGTLGLHLVHALKRQLRGQLRYDWDHGSRFELRCPLPPPGAEA